MPPITIRHATLNDIPALADVERSGARAFLTIPGFELNDRTVSADTLTQMIKNHLLWVAVTDDNQPVGFVGCDAMDAMLYVHEISVAEDYQKQGIGRRLMLTVLEHAKQQNYIAIGLTTRRDVAWNKPFYVSLDFAETSDENAWPQLIQQLHKEIEQGVSADVRCAMVKRLD